jgi:hypothetical protein
MAVVLSYKSMIIDYRLVSLEVEMAVVLSYKSVIIDYQFNNQNVDLYTKNYLIKNYILIAQKSTTTCTIALIVSPFKISFEQFTYTTGQVYDCRLPIS